MNIKKLTLLTTKATQEEQEVDVLTVIITYTDTNSEEEKEFNNAFPIIAFNTPAGYGHAIDLTLQAFTQSLAKLPEVEVKEDTKIKKLKK
jgi:hypothetical protein